MDPEDTPDSADSHSTEDPVDDLADTILDLLEKVFRLYMNSSSSTGSPPGKTTDVEDPTDEKESILDDFYEELLAQIDRLNHGEIQQLKQVVNGSTGEPVSTKPDATESSSTPSPNENLEEVRKQARAEGFEEGYDQGTQHALIQVQDKLEEHYLSYSLKLFLFGEAKFDLNMDPESPRKSEGDESPNNTDS